MIDLFLARVADVSPPSILQVAFSAFFFFFFFWSWLYFFFLYYEDVSTYKLGGQVNYSREPPVSASDLINSLGMLKGIAL